MLSKRSSSKRAWTLSQKDIIIPRCRRWKPSQDSMLYTADAGLDNGWLVRIILPMKEVLCLARRKTLSGDSGSVELM
eukprot:168375-Chlamydomonas_euryale.AAC.4